MQETRQVIARHGDNISGLENVEFRYSALTLELTYRSGVDEEYYGRYVFSGVVKVQFENIKTAQRIDPQSTDALYEIMDSAALVTMRKNWPPSAIWPRKDKVRHFIFVGLNWGCLEVISEEYSHEMLDEDVALGNPEN